MGRHRSVFWMFLTLPSLFVLSYSVAAENLYLERETLPLPVNGTEARTKNPLEPYKMYDIQISSPYDLNPLIPYLRFDGNALAEKKRDSKGDGINQVLFAYLGKGQPLVLKTSRDFSSSVRTAQVEVRLQPEPTPQESPLKGVEEIVPSKIVIFAPILLIAFLVGAAIFDSLRARLKKLNEMLAAEQALQDEYTTRRQVLENTYEYFTHYNDPTWLERYASQKRIDLARRREAIIAAYKELHEDTKFLAHLKLTDPLLYEKATWEMQALALAEQLSVQSPPTPPFLLLPAPVQEHEPEPPVPLPPVPVKPKLTPEERQEKFRRYRERVLERERVQAEDHMAKTTLKLDLFQEFRSSLDQYDLSEDERQQLEQEFLEKLFGEEDDHARSKTI